MSDAFYNANIPLVSTEFDKWQQLFLDNFTQLSRAFAVNHIPLEDSTTAEQHTIVQLIEQAEDIAIQTQIGDFAAYVKNVEGQTDQIFMRYEGNGTEFQFTNYQIYSILATTSQEAYFTVLPGKIMVFFGTVLKATEGKASRILLNPSIAKNIIGINITTFSLITGQVTSLTKTQDEKYITAIETNPSSGSTLPFEPFYYFILANI